MTPTRTLAVTTRVLRQLRRDRRTLAMLFVLPPAMLWLVHAVFSNSPQVFDRIGPLMLGFFPFFMLFVVTAITVQRERSQGTLDRLLASPIGRGDILVGYALAFTLVALVQAGVSLAIGIAWLDLPNDGHLLVTFMIVVGQALLGIALGLALSTYAQTEFQAVQFVPAVVAPQIFLTGLLVPLDALPQALEVVGRALPLTYAFEALTRTMIEGQGLTDGRVQLDLAVVASYVIVALAAGAMTLRRSAP